MKRKCKNIDITNIDFIEQAIVDCLNHKTMEKKMRKATDAYMLAHNYDIHVIALELQSEILHKKLVLEHVKYVDIIDRSNGKKRTLTVEHIKQQFYDYIAYHALNDLNSTLGYYQINVRRKGSPLMAVRYVQGWLEDKNVKYVAQMDAHKCYPSISKENIMKWLNKHVKNDKLLWLVESLLSTCSKGLPIGSYLSIKLCALYMSTLYHYAESNFRYYRRGKEHRAVLHQLFYLDDIFFFGSNARRLTEATRTFIAKAKELGIEIKRTWKMICLKKNRENTHLDTLGYRVYHNRVTMRRRNYVKCRKAIRRYKKKPNEHNSRSLIAMYGLFPKHTNSNKFREKYNADYYYKEAKERVSRYDKSKYN